MKLLKKSCLVISAVLAVGCSSTSNHTGNQDVAYKDNALYKDFSKSKERINYEKTYGGRPHLDKIGGNRVPTPTSNN
jgi:uncharacterized protein YcfL